MIVNKGRKFFTNKGNGIICKGPVNLGNKVEKTILETPIMFNGSCTINGEIGAFTYFSGENTKLHNVKSVGRYCMINGDVVMGMSNMDMNSISAHWIFHNPERYSFFSEFHGLSKQQVRNNKKKDIIKDASIIIGNDVWIGHGVQILPGVIVGDGAIIGAGSIVTKNVEQYTVVAGNPARIIKKRFSDEIINCLQEIKWWEYSPDIFENIDIHNIEDSLLELKRRINSEHYSRYECEKYFFNHKERKILHLDSNNNVIEEEFEEDEN